MDKEPNFKSDLKDEEGKNGDINLRVERPKGQSDALMDEKNTYSDNKAVQEDIVLELNNEKIGANPKGIPNQDLDANEHEDELDRIPPDFELCEKHREANFMRKVIDNTINNSAEDRAK